MAFDEDVDSSRASHVSLQQIRHELARYPAIKDVQGHSHNTLFTELRAAVEPSLIGTDAAPGTLTVQWFVGKRSDPPQFTFHYADETGFDCEWHYHERDHVDGLGHYQERESGTSEYSYEPFEFDSKEPSRVVWEVIDELANLLEARQSR
jgi:hypothetical protein